MLQLPSLQGIQRSKGPSTSQLWSTTQVLAIHSRAWPPRVR